MHACIFMVQDPRLYYKCNIINGHKLCIRCMSTSFCPRKKGHIYDSSCSRDQHPKHWKKECIQLLFIPFLFIETHSQPQGNTRVVVWDMSNDRKLKRDCEGIERNTSVVCPVPHRAYHTGIFYRCNLFVFFFARSALRLQYISVLQHR